MVTFRGATFPLPLRDQRRIASTIVAATVTTVADASTYVDVPLPRRRPSAPGEAAPPAVAVVAPAAGQPTRVVMFGDKRVRIVGPETPYALAAAEGT